MSSLLCICALIGYVMLMTSLSTTNAAPTRRQRSVVDSNRDDTVLSLVLDGSELTDNAVGDNFNLGNVETSRGHRTKRGAGVERHHMQDDVIPLALSEDDLRELTPEGRRRRRSAAWWMAAMVALCDKHKVCRQAEITEGDLTVIVRLADE